MSTVISGDTGITSANVASSIVQDVSNNVGIGVTPSAWAAFKVVQLGNGTFASVPTTSNTVIAGGLYYDGAWKYTNTGYAATLYQANVGEHVWFNAVSGTAGAAATLVPIMKTDSSGNLLVGTTSAIDSTNIPRIQAINGTTFGQYTARSTQASAGKYWNFGASANAYIVYNQGGTGVYMVDGQTSWTANSDERLKTDLIPIENAANKVATLRAVTGRFKTDEEGTSRSFLIAQDVQKVLPEAVDATDPDKLGVQYTDVIPLLVAAIKELNAKVEQQAAEIAALKEA